MINIPIVRIRNGMDDHKPYLKIGKVRAGSSYKWAELTSTRTPFFVWEATKGEKFKW